MSRRLQIQHKRRAAAAAKGNPKAVDNINEAFLPVVKTYAKPAKPAPVVEKKKKRATVQPRVKQSAAEQAAPLEQGA